jgi:malate dehydrogenase (quinone)
MLEVLQRCFTKRLASVSWQERLTALLPSFYGDPQRDPDLLKEMRERSDGLLGPSS